MASVCASRGYAAAATAHSKTRPADNSTNLEAAGNIYVDDKSKILYCAVPKVGNFSGMKEKS